MNSNNGAQYPLKSAKNGVLVHVLSQVVQESNVLWKRIISQVTAVTHTDSPNLVSISKECDLLLAEYKKLTDVMVKIYTMLEEKIAWLKDRGPNSLPEPVPASSLQTVMMLHLVGEQQIGRRLDELQEIDKRRKDALLQLENGLKVCRERFDEMANKLNLLCHMRECLQRDGVLPGNIMYMTHVPQSVFSPFSPAQHMPHVAPAPVSKEPEPVAAHHTLAQDTLNEQDPDKVRRELEKRRALLLQLRQQAREQKSQI